MTSRRDFMKVTAGAAAGLSAASLLRAAAKNGKPMNILWIMAEDMSPELACYGTPEVKTPNLDALARQGARFTNAFTTAAVCSASRSAMITGMYQTSIGAHNHRSHRGDGYTLPDPVRPITDYLRDAGYYTCNVKKVAPGVNGSGKSDFNFNAKGVFDGADWKGRKPGQPFFAQLTFKETHRSFAAGHKWSAENGRAIDPAKVELPSYYPDHPVARQDWADYLEAIQLMDSHVGATIKRLEDEGILDETVIFFIGDHGRCHVRGKQWLYDGGIWIPLIVRWPGVTKANTVVDDLVAAIDISVTILKIAGAEMPDYLEGQVFMGPDAKTRDHVVSARDRCDETVDRIRSVRDKQYKYIRNFFPERPYTQKNAYKERAYPMLNLMKELHAEGKLTPVQQLFMADKRPAEELYDVTKDKWEVVNLADRSEHQATLKKMRGQLDAWIEETGDKGALLEPPQQPKKKKAKGKK